VAVATRREVLASSFRAVLEPRGYLCGHAHDLDSLERTLREGTPDVLILDEELGLADRLEGLARDSAIRDVPVLLYSSGPWRPLDLQGAPERGAAWDVIEEPIRSNVLLEKLDRLFELRELWDPAQDSDREEDGGGLEDILSGLPILDSIASRNHAEIGCVVLGPTRPVVARRAERDITLSSIPDQIRGSDLCAWMGPAELVVFLYDAGIDGVGQFVTRVARSADPRAPTDLSAGIVTLSPRGPKPEERTRGRHATVRVLEHVAAARRALDRAREAGGGVRVGGGI